LVIPVQAEPPAVTESQERGFARQEKPTFARSSVDGQRGPNSVPQAGEVREETVLPETIGAGIQPGISVKQDDPVTELSGGSLPALA
jgi:hypothetical protein